MCLHRTHRFIIQCTGCRVGCEERLGRSVGNRQRSALLYETDAMPFPDKTCFLVKYTAQRMRTVQHTLNYYKLLFHLEWEINCTYIYVQRY